jgi:hypothetical protein
MGGPLKPDFGLSGAVRRLDKVFPPLFCIFVSSIPTRFSSVPHSRGDVTTAGPSTPQIIAFAMIHSGRNDRIEPMEIPTQAKTGLELIG